MTDEAARPVIIVKGDDEVLRRDAVGDLVHALVGDGDASLMVEDLDLSRYGTDAGIDIGVVVDAARTPPFLTDRRVVVARQAGVFSTKDAVAPLVEYLADPLDTTSLILVWEKPPAPGSSLPAVPKSLLEAVRAAGGKVIETKVARRQQDRRAWIVAAVSDSGIDLDPAARDHLIAHVGEDLDRVRSTLDALVAVFGPGTRLSIDDIVPYLGESGQVAPWDLTDAIDAGDVVGALDQLGRLMDGGARHPLQVLATLHGHLAMMLRLDGAPVSNKQQAADLLGLKGPAAFRAEKALSQARRLGSDRLRELIGLLARADLDLRGARGWPPELVVEVLVARLAGRSRTTRPVRRPAS